MTKRQAQKWANELRSGKYKQTRQRLQDQHGHCCLGVACEVFKGKTESLKKISGYLYGDDLDDHRYIRDKLNIGPSGHLSPGDIDGTDSLVTLNDSGVEGLGPFNFDEIADIIELKWVHGAL